MRSWKTGEVVAVDTQPDRKHIRPGWIVGDHAGDKDRSLLFSDRKRVSRVRPEIRCPAKSTAPLLCSILSKCNHRKNGSIAVGKLTDCNHVFCSKRNTICRAGDVIATPFFGSVGMEEHGCEKPAAGTHQRAADRYRSRLLMNRHRCASGISEICRADIFRPQRGSLAVEFRHGHEETESCWTYQPASNHGSFVAIERD